MHELPMHNPFADNPICLILEGSRRQHDTTNCLLTELVAQHVEKKSRIVLKAKGKRDVLTHIATLHNFAPITQNSRYFSNFDLKMSDELMQIVFDKGCSEPLSPALHVHYELGDHADDDVQLESAKRRKTKPIEEHYDDCGDDTKSLDLPELVGLARFFDCTDSEEPPESEEDAMFSGSFFASHFWGSDPTCFSTNLSSTTAFASLSKIPRKGTADFFELYGGKGGVTLISIRRYKDDLNPGRNFDITSNIDLTCPRQVNELMQYLEECKPLVAVMGPPCTAFGSWSSYNQQHNYEAWAESFAIGKPLADIAARVAVIQMKNERYFLCENP